MNIVFKNLQLCDGSWSLTPGISKRGEGENLETPDAMSIIVTRSTWLIIHELKLISYFNFIRLCKLLLTYVDNDEHGTSLTGFNFLMKMRRSRILSTTKPHDELQYLDFRKIDQISLCNIRNRKINVMEQ